MCHLILFEIIKKIEDIIFHQLKKSDQQIINYQILSSKIRINLQSQQKQKINQINCITQAQSTLPFLNNIALQFPQDQHLYQQIMAQISPNQKFFPQTPTPSQTRLQILQQQEQMVHNELNIDSLSINKKLNINSLKDKILKFKKNHSTKNKLHSQLKLNDNQSSSFYQLPQQLNKPKQIKQKLQKIAVPRPKQQKNEMPPKIINQFQNLDSTQITKSTSHARTKFQSTFINEMRQQLQIRENKIPSRFQNYQTTYYNPQFSHQNKFNLQKIKRQKTQQQQSNHINGNSSRFQAETRTKNLHSFKIEPISVINKEKYGFDQKKYRYSEHNNSKLNRSTDKSFIGSKDISRITYTLENFTKKIPITSKYQLDSLEKLISNLWSIYETLISIMQHAQDWPFNSQNEIQKYVQEVCSNVFETLSETISKVNIKRLTRSIKMAKMLENLSIVYLALELTKKQKIKQSHIVNFIGYCTSNIIFIIKILHLVHDLSSIKILNFTQPSKNEQGQTTTHQTKNQNDKKLNDINVEIKPQKDVKLLTRLQFSKIGQGNALAFQYSEKTLSILQTIRKFEINSYKQELKSLLQVIIRMQHNNEIINILQNRLCLKSEKDLQVIVVDFLKKTLRDENQPFFSYARYIFEFLAFYIAKQNLYGVLKCLEVAPQPYLNLKFPRTIVIEPYQVFVFQKKANIIIRAHTQNFINTLSKLCNIVIWTDLMPGEIEPILSLFPANQNIHTLYKYHCIYDPQFNTFAKPLQRLGREIQNILIIDRDLRNFYNNKSNGIEFSWKGEKKDGKILGLLQIIESMLQKNCSLRKSLMEALPEIKNLTLKKKTFQTKRVSNNYKMRNFQQNSLNHHSTSKNQTYLHPITYNQNKKMNERDYSQPDIEQLEEIY